MQELTEEQQKALKGCCTQGCVITYGDFVATWLWTVDALVRVLTLGQGKVTLKNGQIVLWDGCIR